MIKESYPANFSFLWWGGTGREQGKCDFESLPIKNALKTAENG